MTRHTKNKVFSILMAVSLFASVLILSGCDQEQTPADSATKPVYSLSNLTETVLDYTVVSPEAADESIRNALNRVREAISIRTGQAPAMATDALAQGSEADSNKPEILIGDTNRPETAEAKKELKSGEYTIKQIGRKICVVGFDDAATVLAVNRFVMTFFGYIAPEAEHEAERNFHNVADYGAVGDGATDDTAAFRKAIADARLDGLPVYVPHGRYVISKTLVLDSVTLYGYSTGAWTADNCDLPVVYHKNLSEPLFDVVSGSVSGLNIEVLGVDKNTTDAAETVRITDVGGRVSDMTIRNPYIAISTAYGSNYPNNPGRCFIENIFIVQAWHRGLNIYGTYDVATLCNIEVWNNKIENPCPVAFSFGHNDDLRAVNLFAFNAEVGFSFRETPKGDGSQMGSCWGSFTNCSADFTSIGIDVAAGNHHLTFTGGTYWTHFRALNVGADNTNAQIVMSGCEMKSNGAETVTISGGSMVTISGANTVRTMNGYTNACLSIGNCSAAVTVTGNTMVCAGVNVTVDPAYKGVATIVGNTLLSSGNVFTSGVTGRHGIVTYQNNTERGGQKFSD